MTFVQKFDLGQNLCLLNLINYMDLLEFMMEVNV